MFRCHQGINIKKKQAVLIVAVWDNETKQSIL